MQNGDLLTTKEAAELLRVSHWTVSAWLSQGKLTRTKAGGRTLISKADLEAFLRRSSESKSARLELAETVQGKRMRRIQPRGSMRAGRRARTVRAARRRVFQGRANAPQGALVQAVGK
jgi:excisionase family DNA binding protein